MHKVQYTDLLYHIITAVSLYEVCSGIAGIPRTHAMLYLCRRKGMDKIRVGFIGCGRISDLHYLGYKNNRDACLYAVCDSDPQTAERRKKMWKVRKAYTDHRELLADPDIDAVEILTPHKLHEAQVLDAAAARKHISLQKPITLGLDSADRMISAARDSGKIFKVYDSYVWYPPFVQVRKMIDNGEIGTPVNFKIKLIVGGSGGWQVPSTAWQWRMDDFSRGFGEEMFDHGHHLWSTSWFLMGGVDRVKAWIDTLDGMLDTPSVVMWKYRDGVKYGICENVAATRMHIPSKYYTNDEWVEISGTHGIIVVNRCNGNIKCGPPVSLFNGKKWKHYNVRSDWADGFTGSTQNFINAIRGKEEPRLSAEDAKEILKFSLAVKKSALLRKEVYLDELEKRFPLLYNWKRTRREIRENPLKPKKQGIFGGRSSAKYAARAVELTEKLIDRFDPAVASGWDAVIGLHLLPEGGVKDEKFTLTVSAGKAKLNTGSIDKESIMTLVVPAGVWAALLLKKKRIEIAYLQGKLKIEGRAEEALKLRQVFGL